MRPLFVLCLALAACSADPVPQPLCTPGASSACTCSSGASGAQVCDVTRVLGPCVCGSDAGADAADAPAADASTEDATAAPCVPACAAGTQCERGACVAFDGGATDAAGDADAADVPLSDAALATLFRTCEPIGSECAPGVRCMGATFDAGTRGVCTIDCREPHDGVTDRCSRIAGRSTACLNGHCVIGCARGIPCPGDGGYGQCSSEIIGFCSPP